MKTVTIKVREEVYKLAEDMIKLSLAENLNQAFNKILELGYKKALLLVEKKKKVLNLVEKFMKEGLPYTDLPTSLNAIRDRERALTYIPTF